MSTNNNKNTGSSKRAEEVPRQITKRTKFTMSEISSISDMSTMFIPTGANRKETINHSVDEQKVKKEDDAPVSGGNGGAVVAQVKEEDQKVEVKEEMGNDNEDPAVESTTATDEEYNEWGAMLAQHASAVAERERAKATKARLAEEWDAMLAIRTAAAAERERTEAAIERRGEGFGAMLAQHAAAVADSERAATEWGKMLAEHAAAVNEPKNGDQE